MTLSSATENDLESVSKQLGRPVRDIVAIAARCTCGNPIVVQTKPRLEDGTPFPTLYYLTLPAATSAVSTLEAEGLMTKLQDQLSQDEDLAKNYQSAHLSYLSDRAELGLVEEIEGISAGGMPNRVKCLHSLVAHSLAKGPGVNIIGDLALKACSWSPSRCVCEN
ncbi:MAG: DUF501 domain-containing protein [Actinobacteria bacterium]|uniref:Unannotated protein n=1 Tax=freshwater metagenome TaxID=449393 RepID=A0A6J6CV94_9ZZZZ|nr:DUF501 domain-containing protein [Actinomycetota bacterium]